MDEWCSLSHYCSVHLSPGGKTKETPSCNRHCTFLDRRVESEYYQSVSTYRKETLESRSDITILTHFMHSVCSQEGVGIYSFLYYADLVWSKSPAGEQLITFSSHLWFCIMMHDLNKDETSHGRWWLKRYRLSDWLDTWLLIDTDVHLAQIAFHKKGCGRCFMSVTGEDGTFKAAVLRVRQFQSSDYF